MELVHFDKMSIDEVEKLIDQLPFTRGVEVCPVEEAVGRFLSQPCYAQTSTPHYLSSAMDGIALDWRLTVGADKATPILITLEVNAWRVDTGDPLPAMTNAVIKVEELRWLSDKQVEIVQPAEKGQLVRRIGEEITLGETILPAFHKIRAVDLAGLIAGGFTQVEVIRKPVIRVIPTGNELREIKEDLPFGAVRDFDSHMVKAMVCEWGGEVLREDKALDSVQVLAERMQKAAKACDLLVVIAGSSTGREDYTVEALRQCGEVWVHGLAVKPGKPALVGKIGATPVIGLPGLPVAAVLHTELLVQRFLANYLGQSGLMERRKIRAKLKRTIKSPERTDEFIRVKVAEINGETVAVPLSRSAGMISYLLQADGGVHISQEITRLEAGTEIEVELFNPRHEPEKQIIMMGEDDPVFGTLVNYMSRIRLPYEMFCGQVGSKAGVAALFRGEAMIAGICLTEYLNELDLLDLVADEDMCFIKFVQRQKGILFPTKNMTVQNLRDQLSLEGDIICKENDLNSQSEIEMFLKEEGINPDQLKVNVINAPYYLSVGAALAEGVAVAGIGVTGVASLLGQGFVPVVSEQYIFVTHRRHVRDQRIQALIEILKDTAFQKEVSNLGYVVDGMGEEVLITNKNGVSSI